MIEIRDYAISSRIGLSGETQGNAPDLVLQTDICVFGWPTSGWDRTSKRHRSGQFAHQQHRHRKALLDPASIMHRATSKAPTTAPIAAL